MRIEKLTTWQQWVEADRLIATAFLHKWERERSEKEYQAQAEGQEPRNEDTWGLFNDAGRMVSAIVTRPCTLSFEGAFVPCRDVNMVGSLPEERGGGHIRQLMDEILHSCRKNGELFAVLHPFSFAFYRKFGFELAASQLAQRVPIDQLAGFSCGYAVTRTDSQEDVNVLRGLYEAAALRRNLSTLRTDRDWAFRGDGEYGQPNWWEGDRPSYTYLFRDGSGAPHAYFKFQFKEGSAGPMLGEMEIRDLVFDSPEAFRNVLGFLYGMRAKVTHVQLSMPEFVDLAALIPECDKAERSLEGHTMARALNVPEVLSRLQMPSGSQFTIEIQDSFLRENCGVYLVSAREGGNLVSPVQAPADLCLSAQTLAPLSVGTIDLSAACYRDGTLLRGNKALLAQVFCKKPVGL
ncbi:MAG: GNAT family N-acetyltransferase [Oscillospiraceae bacterium]|nr:GNAT family N-acetyltransferase [Oscillospiraceae bacterium]